MHKLVNWKGPFGVRRAMFFSHEGHLFLIEGSDPEIQENGYIACKPNPHNPQLRETFGTHNFNVLVDALRVHMEHTRHDAEQQELPTPSEAGPSMPVFDHDQDADGVITLNHEPGHEECRALNKVYDDLLHKTMVRVWNKTLSERKPPVTAGVAKRVTAGFGKQLAATTGLLLAGRDYNGAAGASARASTDASSSSVAQPLGKRKEPSPTTPQTPVVIHDTESEGDEENDSL